MELTDVAKKYRRVVNTSWAKGMTGVDGSDEAMVVGLIRFDEVDYGLKVLGCSCDSQVVCFNAKFGELVRSRDRADSIKARPAFWIIQDLFCCKFSDRGVMSWVTEKLMGEAGEEAVARAASLLGNHTASLQAFGEGCGATLRTSHVIYSGGKWNDGGVEARIEREREGV